MDHPQFSGSMPVMFFCGNGDRRGEVKALVSELGVEAVDAGDLQIAQLLEPFAMLWIHLALRTNMGREFGFAVLRK